MHDGIARSGDEPQEPRDYLKGATPVTGDELYERYVAEARESFGGDIPESHLESIRGEAYSPAVLLGYNTTACPPWCNDRGGHDTSGPEFPQGLSRQCIVHYGPQLLEVSYDGTPNPTAAGWGVQLVAYEYVAKPGRLHYMLDMAGQEDGLRGGDCGWHFDLPPDWLRQLSALVPQMDELLGGAA